MFTRDAVSTGESSMVGNRNINGCPKMMMSENVKARIPTYFLFLFLHESARQLPKNVFNIAEDRRTQVTPSRNVISRHIIYPVLLSKKSEDRLEAVLSVVYLSSVLKNIRGLEATSSLG